MSRAEREPERLVSPSLRVFALIPAVTAAVLGFLYALGALFKASEIRGAGLAAREVLPLIPLQQLLGRGVAVVFDNYVVLLIWLPALAIVALWARREHASSEVLKGHLHALGETSSELSARHEALQERLSTIRAALDSGDAAALPDASLGPEVAELQREAEAVQALVHQAEQHRDAFDAALPAWVDRIPDWFSPVAAGFIVVVSTANLLFGDPPGSVAFAIAGLLYLLPAFRRLQAFPHMIALSTGITLSVLFLGSYFTPPALPLVKIETEQGPVTGMLVATTGTEWFLSNGTDGTLRGVPADLIESMLICHVPRARGESLWTKFTGQDPVEDFARWLNQPKQAQPSPCTVRR